MLARAEPVQDLIPQVYDDLRRMARWFFRKQQPGFTLQPTELVNEACIQLMTRSGSNWQDADHFRAVATRKIWQVLVDHIRRRNATKRGGPGTTSAKTGSANPDDNARRPAEPWQRVPLDSVAIDWHDRTVDLLDLADSLDALGAASQRLREVVMLHWFSGLTYSQTGRILGISASTAEKDFRYALAWLNRALCGEPDNGR